MEIKSSAKEVLHSPLKNFRVRPASGQGVEGFKGRKRLAREPEAKPHRKPYRRVEDPELVEGKLSSALRSRTLGRGILVATLLRLLASDGQAGGESGSD